MIVTLPLSPVDTFISEHPWPAVALVFVAVVIAPAVWSNHRDRRCAAMAVIRVIVEAVTAIAVATRRCDGTSQNPPADLTHAPRKPSLPSLLPNRYRRH